MGWSVEATAGSVVHDPLAARISSTSGSLGAAFEGARRWGYASLGTPLSGGGPSWGAAGAGAWLAAPWRTGELGVRLEVDGFGYGSQDSVSSGLGVSGRVLPTLVMERAGLRAEVGAGAAGTLLEEGDSSAHRVMAEAAGQLAWSSAGGATVAAIGRYLRDSEAGFPYAGVSAALERGRGSVWAEAGAWLGSRQPTPRAALGVGAELRLPGRTVLAASWRQEPADPLFRSAPRQNWSLGLRRAFGADRPAGRPLRPPVAAVARGSVTFRLPMREHPQPPALVSDLTGWQPVPLAASGSWWTVTLPVQPGVHQYVFRTAAGGSWLPPDVPRQSDGFGGHNALLVVP